MAESTGPVYHQNLGAAPRTLLFLRPKGAISTYKWEAWIREILETPPPNLRDLSLPGARCHWGFLILEAIFQHEGL